MKTWIETNWYRIVYGWEHEDRSSKGWIFRGNNDAGLIRTSWETLEEAMNEFTQWASDYQYEIKAVLPHTSAFYDRNVSTTQHHSWGYGYGFSSITGCTFVIQRTLEVSDEEYEKRSMFARMRARKKEIEGLLPQKEKELEEAREKRDAIKEEVGNFSEVKERKRLLGGGVFYVLDGERQYATREEAEAVLEGRRQAVAQAEEKVSGIEQIIAGHKKELEEIERALSQPAG